MRHSERFVNFLHLEDFRETYDQTIVLATGCFDVLHRGHVELLDQCARLSKKGSRFGLVMVGLNSDESIRELKGPTRPINTFEDRACVISSLRSVNYYTKIDDLRVSNCISLLRPDYWVKGGDYTLDTLDKTEVAAAKQCKTEIVIIPRIGNYSTTSIITQKT